MAINWLFALKAVPWADLVQAAPHIVKGARRLFNTSRQSEPPPVGAAVPRTGGRDADSVQARLSQVEAALQNLDAEQQSTAELIRSLAEQNARVVEVIEVLRARTRVLLGVGAALTIAVIVLAAWVVS